MNKYGFVVRWGEEDQVYIAICPEFPGVSAFGDTPDDAIREVQVALGAVIEDMAEDGWDLPQPQTMPIHSGQFRLRVPRTLHGQLAERAELEGVSLNTLAVSYLAAGLGGPGAPPTPTARAEPASREAQPKRRSKAA